jgi:tripartite-type tricarboxylate transporter receptor subunit TctC
VAVTLGYNTFQNFSYLTGIQMNHVPYKGQGLAAQGLLAGHLQVMFDAFNFAQPNIKAGKVKALGMTGAKRHTDLSDLPTIADHGAPCVTTNWIALLLPETTPATIVDKLQKDLASILQKPEVKERFNRLGINAVSNQPAALFAWSQGIHQNKANGRARVQDSKAEYL